MGKSAPYGWIITRDFIFDGEAKGTCGPRNIEPAVLEALRNNGADCERFRILDDDGELYYHGRLYGGTGFEPLWDFAMPNAGATTIEIRNPKTGQYETL